MDHEHPHAELLRQAFLQLRSAIELLDAAGAPGHIAGHADLAMNLLADLADLAELVEPRLARPRGNGAVLSYH